MKATLYLVARYFYHSGVYYVLCFLGPTNRHGARGYDTLQGAGVTAVQILGEGALDPPARDECGFLHLFIFFVYHVFFIHSLILFDV